MVIENCGVIFYSIDEKAAKGLRGFLISSTLLIQIGIILYLESRLYIVQCITNSSSLNFKLFRLVYNVNLPLFTLKATLNDS